MLPVDAVRLVFVGVDLVIDRFGTFPDTLHLFGMSGHPVDGTGGENHYTTCGIHQQLFMAEGVVFRIDHDGPLDAQQVMQPLVIQCINPQSDTFFFMHHCQRVAEYMFQPGIGALLLKVQRGGHCIAVADADSRMPEPFRLAAQIFRRAAGVQQLVGGMDAEVHERYIMYRRLGPADIFQQVETEFFPQVIVVPVPAEREGHMEDSFFHQHIRTFHQVEHELVPVAAEDGFHSRQVGREKPPEAGNIHHFRIDRDIGYPLCIEP